MRDASEAAACNLLDKSNFLKVFKTAKLLNNHVMGSEVVNFVCQNMEECLDLADEDKELRKSVMLRAMDKKPPLYPYLPSLGPHHP